MLAGIAAENEEERIRAQMALADVPLKRFLSECVVPYETDVITRLILDSHDARAFAPVSSFTVGQLRDWLLTPAADTEALTALAPGLTPRWWPRPASSCASRIWCWWPPSAAW